MRRDLYFFARIDELFSALVRLHSESDQSKFSSLWNHSSFPVTASSTPAPWGFSIGMCAQVTETSWKVLTSSCSRLIVPSRSTLLPRCEPDDKKQKPMPQHESSEFKTAAFSLTMWLTLTTHRIPMKAITVNSQRLTTPLVLTAPL